MKNVPKLTYKRCRICGAHSDNVGPLSHTRLCETCWTERFEGNLHDLRAHSGPFFQAHRRACVAAFGGVLVDDLREEA